MEWLTAKVLSSDIVLYQLMAKVLVWDTAETVAAVLK
jgi:hypothetical protein